MIPDPTALVTLDTQKIIVDPGAGEPLENAQWTDSLPKLLQARFIESFEKSRYVGAVARPMDSITPDFQLLIDIRKFEIEGTAAAPVAHVELAAKVVGKAGRIVGSRTFDASVPAKDTTARGRRSGARRGVRQGRDPAGDVGRRSYVRAGELRRRNDYVRSVPARITLSLPGLTGQSSNPCPVDAAELRASRRSPVVTGSPGQAGR